LFVGCSFFFSFFLVVWWCVAGVGGVVNVWWQMYGERGCVMRLFDVVLDRVLGEDFAGHFGVRDRWVVVGPGDVDADPSLADELFRLIDVSYGGIGGHVDFRSSGDLLDACRDRGFVVYAIDVDDDRVADATIVSKLTRFGEKGVASATDGSRVAKDALVSRKVGDFGSSGYYGEVSDALAAVLLRRGVNVVTDPEVVRRVLGKDIEWLGGDPSGRLPGLGWYRRRLGGDFKNKIMVGFPLGLG